MRQLSSRLVYEKPWLSLREDLVERPDGSQQLPSGSFPAGVSGTPEELAAAELRDETGLTALRLTRVGYLNPANVRRGSRAPRWSGCCAMA